MGVIRYKIWSDLWKNKGRTIAVVLIIGLGAAALGMIVGTRNLVINTMASGWQAINPAMIGLAVGPPIDNDTIASLERIPGLDDVEGYAQTSIEWRLDPEDEWLPASLVARDDYVNQVYNKVDLLSGDWPEEEIFAAHDNAVNFFGVPLGGQVYIRADGREHVVQVNGMVGDQLVAPPTFGGTAQFYTTRERLEELTGMAGMNLVLAGAPEFDEEALSNLADEIQRKLEKEDVDSGGFIPPTFNRVVNPEKHFFQDVMDGIFLVLAILAVFALILSLFLVYNTINALISQQVDQIGVMKAIGARTWQIFTTYLLLIFGYSLLALLISLPLGAIGGWGLTIFLVSSFSAEAGSFTVSQPALIAQLAVVFIAPLLAAIGPIITGSRITVNEAVNTYGLSAEPSVLDKLLNRIRRLPRLLLLMVSNTFRKKGRVFLTEVTLVLSGLIFMMVIIAQDSAAFTFSEVIFSILDFDVSLVLREPERIRPVESLMLAHPDVKAVEMWGLNNATIRLAGQPESEDDEGSLLFGVPLPTTLYGPQMRSGRWLTPEDEFAVVLNQNLAEDAGVTIGDWVTFDHGVSGESDWLVVGLLFDPIISNTAHVPRQALLRELGSVGRASTLWIQTERDDPASQIEAAKSIRQYLEDNQYDVAPVGVFSADTSGEITAQTNETFGIIVTLLLVMAFVIAIVGGIALSGTLSLNVIERRREIGVMRAIGARSGNVALLFVGEGLILGFLSWAIAVPLSLPAGQLMVDAIGSAIGNEIVYHYTPTGALIWLAIISFLSIVASWFPARSATRISVRESLAYQ